MPLKNFFLALIFFSIFCKSQFVEIKGIAKDTTKNRSFVKIDINDTLFKFRQKAAITKNWEGYHELTQDKNYSTYADSTGIFKIKAKVTDSIAFYSYRYFKQNYAVSDLLKMNSIKIQLEPEPCIPYKSCEQKTPSNYFIFVGEKIEVKGEEIPYYCNTIIMDGKFKATYKVLKNVYGKHPLNTFSFYAFDHYGTPNFSKYKNVLLFVGEYCNEFYHTKYQYFDIYKTKNGKWATPGDPYKYNLYTKDKYIKAKTINFDKNVYFDISDYSKERIAKEYPKEYYKVIGNRAIPIKGIYISEMIKVKENVFKEFNIKL